MISYTRFYTIKTTNWESMGITSLKPISVVFNAWFSWNFQPLNIFYEHLLYQTVSIRWKCKTNQVYGSKVCLSLHLSWHILLMLNDTLWKNYTKFHANWMININIASKNLFIPLSKLLVTKITFTKFTLTQHVTCHFTVLGVLF